MQTRRQILVFPRGWGRSGEGGGEAGDGCGKMQGQEHTFSGRFLLRMSMDWGNSGRVKRGKPENSPAL